jgi:hypothetical protein
VPGAGRTAQLNAAAGQALLLTALPLCACVLQVGHVPGQAAGTLRRHHHTGWQQEQALTCECPRRVAWLQRLAR